MLRLPPFEFHQPQSIDDALRLLETLKGQSVRLLAGGTDLVPNMKHEITAPAHVVSLKHVGLAGLQMKDHEIVIGAMTSLHALANDTAVQRQLPALAAACQQIAGPQLRRMGTLGGNLCLDTRCLFINQTYFWRSALGFCLKKDGTVCHVVKGGQHCVAAASNDSALPLMLYGATVRLRSPRDERAVALVDFYVTDGIKNTIIEADEVLTHIYVPVQAPSVRVAFEKLRTRKSIDFPLLNLAALTDHTNGALSRCELAISALGARPKIVSLTKHLAGGTLDDATIALAGRKAHAACRPLTNIATDPEWRRAMIPVLVRRALQRLRDTARFTAVDSRAG